jgi:hypothetical protein
MITQALGEMKLSKSMNQDGGLSSENLKAALETMEHSFSGRSKTGIVRTYLVHISALRQAGFNFESIATLFREQGIELSAETLGRLYRRTVPRRPKINRDTIPTMPKNVTSLPRAPPLPQSQAQPEEIKSPLDLGRLRRNQIDTDDYFS